MDGFPRLMVAQYIAEPRVDPRKREVQAERCMLVCDCSSDNPMGELILFGTEAFASGYAAPLRPARYPLQVVSCVCGIG